MTLRVAIPPDEAGLWYADDGVVIAALDTKRGCVGLLMMVNGRFEPLYGPFTVEQEKRIVYILRGDYT